MAKKKITRKELLKNTDEFLTFSGKAALFFNQHLRELKLAGIGLGIIAVAYISIWGYLRHTNKAGQEAYNAAYDTVIEVSSAGNVKEAVLKSEPLFQTVIDDYSMSRAATLALAQVGHAKFEEGQYDDAVKYYHDYGDEASGQSYETLSKLAIAACYEAKGDYKKAIETLDPVLKISSDPFRETAMVDLERLYRLDNQPEKAKEILQSFANEYANSPFFRMLKTRI